MNFDDGDVSGESDEDVIGKAETSDVGVEMSIETGEVELDNGEIADFTVGGLSIIPDWIKETNIDARYTHLVSESLDGIAWVTSGLSFVYNLVNDVNKGAELKDSLLINLLSFGLAEIIASVATTLLLSSAKEFIVSAIASSTMSVAVVSTATIVGSVILGGIIAVGASLIGSLAVNYAYDALKPTLDKIQARNNCEPDMPSESVDWLFD